MTSANTNRPAYISVTDAAKLIRSQIKAQLGLTARQVSVRSDSYSMGSSIHVEIKVLGVSLEKVTAIAEGKERIDRDESGEILSGGNRYVHIRFSPELRSELAKLGAKVALPGGAVRSTKVCGYTVTRSGDSFEFCHETDWRKTRRVYHEAAAQVCGEILNEAASAEAVA